MEKAKKLETIIAELQAAVQSLMNIGDALIALSNQISEPNKSETLVQEQANPEPSKPTPLTLEQVRGILADKSRDGFTAEIRILLEKYGGSKLSEIPPERYGELLKDAEGLV